MYLASWETREESDVSDQHSLVEKYRVKWASCKFLEQTLLTDIAEQRCKRRIVTPSCSVFRRNILQQKRRAPTGI